MIHLTLHRKLKCEKHEHHSGTSSLLKLISGDKPWSKTLSIEPTVPSREDGSNIHNRQKGTSEAYDLKEPLPTHHLPLHRLAKVKKMTGIIIPTKWRSKSSVSKAECYVCIVDRGLSFYSFLLAIVLSVLRRLTIPITPLISSNSSYYFVSNSSFMAYGLCSTWQSESIINPE